MIDSNAIPLRFIANSGQGRIYRVSIDSKYADYLIPSLLATKYQYSSYHTLGGKLEIPKLGELIEYDVIRAQWFILKVVNDYGIVYDPYQ